MLSNTARLGRNAPKPAASAVDDGADGIDDADVPPLEDMSHVFSKLSTADGKQTPLSRPVQLESLAASTLPDTSSKQMSATSPSGATPARSAVSAKTASMAPAVAPAASKEFSGLKKGFFGPSSSLSPSPSPSPSSSSSSSSSPSHAAASATAAKPVLRPASINTKPAAGPSKLAQSMHIMSPSPVTSTPPTASSAGHADHDAMPFLRASGPATGGLSESLKSMFKVNDDGQGPPWMTDKFWQRIQSSPTLMKALGHPDFAQAAQDLESNPQEAFTKYAKSKPELMAALRELAAIIGDQLLSYADESDKSSAPSSRRGSAADALSVRPAVPDDLPAHEKRLVERVLNDPLVQDALRDPDVQRILSDIQRSGADLMKIMRSSPQPVLDKLNKLIDCGLLQIQR
ncbi:hypothetical protein BC831DRAFT_446739 [Entophlyctis helioformis]|nr:hypothetical protein BC831DRAFT_446739 [Entophlyctis helioformis]